MPPRWLFVRVETEDGAFGWGEASLEGWAEAVEGAFEAFRDRFIGADPFSIEDIWQVGYRGGFYRGGPVIMSALAGLEQALWDLKGRVLGLPAWQMLGGKVRDKVRSYAWIGGDRPHEIARSGGGAEGAGFQRRQDERDRRARLDRHAQAVRRCGEARRGGAGAGDGRRPRLPRPRAPAAGQAAGEGAGAARPAVHRGAAAVREPGGPRPRSRR